MQIPVEMRKKYLERRERDERELSEALVKRDFEPFVRIGHQVKGNAPTFGYDSLGELGRRIEAAGENGDVAAAELCLEELRAWIASQA